MAAEHLSNAIFQSDARHRHAERSDARARSPDRTRQVQQKFRIVTRIVAMSQHCRVAGLLGQSRKFALRHQANG